MSYVSGQFKTQLSPSLRGEEKLNPLASLFPSPRAALQTFLVCMGTTALPRASAALQAPGACGRSWGCWLFSPRVPVQLWPFVALWAGHCVPGETVLDPHVLGSVPPCPHLVTSGSERRCGTGGPCPAESSLCHAHLSLAFLIYRIREGTGLQDRGKGGLLTNRFTGDWKSDFSLFCH